MDGKEPLLNRLVADVGGTNTRLAISRDGKLDTTTLQKIRNVDFSDLEAVLAFYLTNSNETIDEAAVAVAGPVQNGKGELTNRAWKFDEISLAKSLQVDAVFVLNDLQAQGHAIGKIPSENIRSLWQPTEVIHADATKLVIGVGTGFNAAAIINSASPNLVLPAECGHSSLPQEDEADRLIAEKLQENFGFASVEDALSGRGFENLHNLVVSENSINLSSQQIFEAANKGDFASLQTVQVFCRLMARTSGNIALNFLPFGGVYLIGGMARAVTEYLDRFDFVDHFQSKGRFSDLMKQFPIALIEDDFAALYGLTSIQSRQ